MNILLCGYSGSGKTILAHQLSQTLGYSIIPNTDVGNFDLHSASPVIRKIAYLLRKGRQIKDIAKVHGEEGIIIDSSNLTKRTRKICEMLLGPHRPLNIIHTTCPTDVLMARLKSRGNFDFWWRLHTYQTAKFQLPQGENVFTYNTHTDSPDMLISRLIPKCG